MKLLYFAPDFHPARGGYSSACTAFAEALARDGRVDVDVATFVPLGQAAELPLAGRSRVWRLGDTPLGRAAPLARQVLLARRLLRMARQGGHDLVLLETAEFPWAARRLQRALPGRVMTRVHASAETEWVLYRDHWQYRMKRGATRKLFRESPVILATAPYYLGFVRERFLGSDPILAAAKTWAVVPNVVRDENPSWSPPPLAAGGEISLLTLGRMDVEGERQKNFARVVLALSRLRGKPYFDRLRLRVVGEGPMRPALERLAREAGVDKSVELVSQLPGAALGEAQRSSSAVILASTYEGMSMFALESLAHGAPMLVGDVGGLRALVDDGVNGALFDPLDTEAIARAIDRFVVEMLPREREVRLAARAKFEREFASVKVVDRFVRECELVLAARRAAL